MIASTALSLLLLKATLWFGGALLALPLMRRSTAALRHLLCASVLAGSLLLPLTAFFEPRVMAFRVPLIVSFAARSTGASPAPSTPLLEPLLICWAAGAAILLLRIAIGYYRMKRLLDRATPLPETQAVPVFAADVSVPLVTGLLRPVILLPRSSASWSESQRHAALRHELVHLDRGDLWSSLAGHAACALYWFHPLVWMLAIRLRKEQESACDDAVIHSGFEASSYAEALVAAARDATSTLVTSSPVIGCPMITHTSGPSLKSRIARLLDCSLPRISPPSTLRRAALACAIALIAIGMLNAGPQVAPVDNSRVYRMDDGVTPPSVLLKVDPEYSQQARDAKIEGTVLLSVVIGTEGLAHNISIMQRLGAGLDEKAVEAVEQWHFQPGTLNGEPVAVQAQIEINFRLK